MRLGVEAALLDGTIVPGDIETADGVIQRVGIVGQPGSGLAVPGFIDLQVNGFVGVDLVTASVDEYEIVAGALAATGVTSFQPTLITLPESTYVAALEVAGAAANMDLTCRLLGVHLEGPFLSPIRSGAHDPANITRPDPDLARRLIAAGPVTYTTLAPELPGGLEVLEVFVEAGVTVSVGHSDATAPQTAAAFDRGARSVTHLFNAQRGLHHREPGVSGAALVHPTAAVTIIVDGIHLAPEVVQLVFAAAPGRVALITDAIEAAGVGDGVYMLGDRTVQVADGAARLEGGVLAGSIVTMDESIRNLVDIGIPFVSAIEAATKVPAAIIERSQLGSLTPGTVADVTVLDDGINVQRTLLAGRETFLA